MNGAPIIAVSANDEFLFSYKIYKNHWNRLIPTRTEEKATLRAEKEWVWIAFTTIIILVSLIASAIYINNLTHLPTSFSSLPTSPSIVLRGGDNIVFYRTLDSSKTIWNSWIPLPGQNSSDSPAAVLVGGELHIVIRDADQNLHYGYVDGSGVFSNWTQISGSTPSAPALATNGTVLCLVVRGQDNLIWYRFYYLTSRNWTAWAPIPLGTTSDSPAVAILGGKLHVVVRGNDSDILYQNTMELATENFSGWHTISNGTTRSAPTLAASHELDEVFLLVRGLNDQIYINSWHGSTWGTTWDLIEDMSTIDGPGACVIGNELRVVVRDIEGITIWQGSVNLVTAFFSGWKQIDGSTLSRPTLTG